MAEIPGAREELDRLWDELLSYVQELVEHLTPGQTLKIYRTGHSIVDWHEPLLHQSTLIDQVAVPVAHHDGSLVAKAGEWLTAAGFEVEVTRETLHDAGGTAHTAIATKDGLEVEVRVVEGMSHVFYRGETPKMALYTTEPFVRPEPVTTAETLSAGAVLCYECDGLGWCHSCYGRGWVSDEERGRKRCRQCFHERVCPICRGAGELWISELNDYALEYYPELASKRLAP